MEWELKVKDRLRNLLGEAWGKNKRPPWIDESYWAAMCNLWNTLRIKSSPNGIRGAGLRDREDGEPGSTWQKDLIERFSLSKYLEELHKHQKGEKNVEYADFYSAQFWKKFHEVRKKAEEDAEASSTPMLDDLQLMAIVACGVSRGRLYGAGSKAAHFIAESN
ncbi:hypothetical protein M9H77_03010 [Catharanthus roseus]|uniref:Uncharacterized protein n=1 Tax=Catharanthus roseus TaxID=4058 RepID=A0ACC0CA71_CATRO|nr:hypothetical protein M9H77_03010 [Catharanthus roseus]